MAEEIYEMKVDPGMEGQNEETEETHDPMIMCDFVTGTSMSAEYKASNLEDMWNHLEDMDGSILELKKMMFELVSTPVDQREAHVKELIDVLTKFHAETGLTNIDYNIREDLTDYEKCILMDMNLIILFTEMRTAAQLHHVQSNTNALAHDFEALFSGLDEFKTPGELIESFIDQTTEESAEESGNDDKEEVTE
jgi:hypothetical protein